MVPSLLMHMPALEKGQPLPLQKQSPDWLEDKEKFPPPASIAYMRELPFQRQHSHCPAKDQGLVAGHPVASGLSIWHGNGANSKIRGLDSDYLLLLQLLEKAGLNTTNKTRLRVSLGDFRCYRRDWDLTI